MAYQLKPGFLSNVLGQSGLSSRAYANKVLSIDRANLIAYWKLNEKTGTNAVNLEGTAARDGTYTGVTLDSATGPGGQPVGLWDGAADYCDIYSASLNTAFNGAEGTVAIWAKVSGAGVWTDAANRYGILLYADGNNSLRIEKSSTSNRITYFYQAGGTSEVILKNDASSIGWMCLALTWSAGDDEVKAYYNGAQNGSTATVLGVWGGAGLDSNKCLIGASAKPSEVWDGYEAHAAIWTTPLTSAQIALLAVPRG